MVHNDEWDLVRQSARPRFGNAGMGLIRISLLFGSAAVALALIAAPMLEKIGGSENAALARASLGVDTMSTGAIANGRAYTVRRSVLQPSPNSTCIIRQNGTRIGDC